MPSFLRVSWWIWLLHALFLAVWGAIVLPRFLTRSESGPKPTQTQISSFKTSLQSYAQDNGRAPTTAQGLQALIEKPTQPPIPRRWQRYMDIPAVPNDEWGRPFVYERPGPYGSPFLILSLGQDGRRGTKDDVSSE